MTEHLRYPGFRLVCNRRIIDFYKYEFPDLIKGLATQEKYGLQIAEQIEKKRDFNIGNITIKYTSYGSIWKSPRTKIHKTSGKTIKLNYNELYSLCQIFRDGTFTNYYLGDYSSTRRRFKNKYKRCIYIRKYISKYCFYVSFFKNNWPIFPSLVHKIIKRRNNYNKCKKRQSHGNKTISRHYIKKLDNQYRLTTTQ